MANKATSTTCTCHSCDNPYFVRAQIIAKSAGSPAYRFGIDESVSLLGNQHGFVRDILDGGKIYVVQMFEKTLRLSAGFFSEDTNTKRRIS